MTPSVVRHRVTTARADKLRPVFPTLIRSPDKSSLLYLAQYSPADDSRRSCSAYLGAALRLLTSLNLPGQTVVTAQVNCGPRQARRLLRSGRLPTPLVDFSTRRKLAPIESWRLSRRVRSWSRTQTRQPLSGPHRLTPRRLLMRRPVASSLCEVTSPGRPCPCDTTPPASRARTRTSDFTGHAYAHPSDFALQPSARQRDWAVQLSPPSSDLSRRVPSAAYPVSPPQHRSGDLASQPSTDPGRLPISTVCEPQRRPLPRRNPSEQTRRVAPVRVVLV